MNVPVPRVMEVSAADVQLTPHERQILEHWWKGSKDATGTQFGL